jgi:hypothetical protein
MNKQQLDKLSGLGSNSLLVIGQTGLKRIYCPFAVVCLEPVQFHFPGDVFLVTQVKLSQNLDLAYEIDKEYYLYRFYRIL